MFLIQDQEAKLATASEIESENIKMAISRYQDDLSQFLPSTDSAFHEYPSHQQDHEEETRPSHQQDMSDVLSFIAAKHLQVEEIIGLAKTLRLVHNDSLQGQGEVTLSTFQTAVVQKWGERDRRKGAAFTRRQFEDNFSRCQKVFMPTRKLKETLCVTLAYLATLSSIDGLSW